MPGTLGRGRGEIKPDATALEGVLVGVNAGSASEASINMDSSIISESRLLDWKDSKDIEVVLPLETVSRFLGGE